MRIRTIKPEFWTDDKVTECSLSARLLLIGALNVADDEGNLERSAKQLKAKIFPHDHINCEPFIKELITHGLLIEYSADGGNYLHIKGFKKHQVINRASKPRCPLFDDSLTTHETLSESSIQEVEGKGKEGKGGERKQLRGQAACVRPDEVPEKIWQDFLAVRKAKRAPLTETALAGIRTEAAKAGYSLVDALETCCRRNWQGFEAAWLARDAPTFGKTSQGIALLEQMKG
jgi:hypothetical protein